MKKIAESEIHCEMFRSDMGEERGEIFFEKFRRFSPFEFPGKRWPQEFPEKSSTIFHEGRITLPQRGEAKKKFIGDRQKSDQKRSKKVTKSSPKGDQNRTKVVPIILLRSPNFRGTVNETKFFHREILGVGGPKRLAIGDFASPKPLRFSGCVLIFPASAVFSALIN